MSGKRDYLVCELAKLSRELYSLKKRKIDIDDEIKEKSCIAQNLRKQILIFDKQENPTLKVCELCQSDRSSYKCRICEKDFCSQCSSQYRDEEHEIGMEPSCWKCSIN